MPLPKNAMARKEVPIATGFVDYFPDAIAAVAHLSKVGNDQHNPGGPLRWDRSKSGDESDALMRHFLERGTTDSDGIRHSAKVAWRALAMLQKEIEADLDEEHVHPYDVRESILTEAEKATLGLFDREVLKQYQQKAALDNIKSGIQQPVRFHVNLSDTYPFRAGTVDEIEEWQRNKADSEAYLRRLNEEWDGGLMTVQPELDLVPEAPAPERRDFTSYPQSRRGPYYLHDHLAADMVGGATLGPFDSSEEALRYYAAHQKCRPA